MIGFDRGGAVTLVTRLPVGLDTAGGWAGTTVDLPAAAYRDALTGRVHGGGQRVPVAELLRDAPVALLVAVE